MSEPIDDEPRRDDDRGADPMRAPDPTMQDEPDLGARGELPSSRLSGLDLLEATLANPKSQRGLDRGVPKSPIPPAPLATPPESDEHALHAEREGVLEEGSTPAMLVDDDDLIVAEEADSEDLIEVEDDEEVPRAGDKGSGR
jgi:hypothetical protein